MLSAFEHFDEFGYLFYLLARFLLFNYSDLYIFFIYADCIYGDAAFGDRLIIFKVTFFLAALFLSSRPLPLPPFINTHTYSSYPKSLRRRFLLSFHPQTVLRLRLSKWFIFLWYLIFCSFAVVDSQLSLFVSLIFVFLCSQI